MSEVLLSTLKSDEGLLTKATRIKTKRGGRERNYTIGYGYNLSSNKDPKGDLIAAGVDEELVDDVIKGRAEINEEQASALLEISAKRAKLDAKRTVSNFDKLPEDVQNVVVNMSYQLGAGRLKGFKRFREALYKGDYEAAAKEVIDSDMYRDDSPERSTRHAEALRKAAATPPPPRVGDNSVRIKDARRELLIKRAAEAHRGDPRIPRLADLVKNMPVAPPLKPKTEEVTPNGSP